MVFKKTEAAYREYIMHDQSGRAFISAPGQMLCGAAAGFVECAAVVQPFERGKTLRADFQSPYTVRVNQCNEQVSELPSAHWIIGLID